MIGVARHSVVLLTVDSAIADSYRVAFDRARPRPFRRANLSMR
jgi:hypothetical protein